MAGEIAGSMAAERMVRGHARGASPVCATCNDTHAMVLHKDGDVDQTVMCTGCPTPCQKCRQGGNGPYCGVTPCGCACHRRASSPTSRATILAAHRQHGGTLPYNTDGIITRELVADGFLHVLRPEGKPSCTEITGAGLTYLAEMADKEAPCPAPRVHRYGPTIDRVIDSDACSSFERKDWAALAIAALDQAGLTFEQLRSIREAVGRFGLEV